MGAYFGEGRRTEGEWKGEGMKEKRRREEKEGEGNVFAGPMSNYLLRACERLHGKGILHIRMHTCTCMLKLSYSTRTTMKRTDFSRRFNKPDLNVQKVYAHSQSSGHIQKS